MVTGDGAYDILDDKKEAFNEYKAGGEPTLKASDMDIYDIVHTAIYLYGNKADLNFIDMSEITSTSSLFLTYTEFDGDVSRWFIRKPGKRYKVTDMSFTFSGDDGNPSWFNGDISKWDVSTVTDMTNMFSDSYFDGDLSKWDVSNVKNMELMFCSSQFTGRKGDITGWFKKRPGVRYAIRNMDYMFMDSLYDGDISDWDVSGAKGHMECMFMNSEFDTSKISGWAVQPT